MMYAFSYHAPISLSEARKRFEESEDAAYISGGHTLLPTMKNRLAAPSDLVSLGQIEELQGIAVAEGCLTIGAAETHASVAASDAVTGRIPALAGLAGSIGDVQVRHRGTIGGSVANNDPAADYPSAVLALDARLHTSERVIEASDFFQGVYTTALEPGEILTKVGFRIPDTAGYAKMRNPASRYALAAAFVARFGDSVRVAITGASEDGVFRWTEAEERLSKEVSAGALAGLTLNEADMNEDIHASRGYRAHLAALCTRKAAELQGRLTLL